MDIAKQLAKGSPQTCWPGDLMPGGIPEITWEMVEGALALGKCEPAQSEYYRVKYKEPTRSDHRKSTLYTLKQYLLEYVIAPKSYRWSLPKQWPERLDNMAMLAAEESVGSGQCGLCAGSGTKVTPTKPEPCPRCKGTGGRAFNHRFRARRLGVARSEYDRVWRGRYEAVLHDGPWRWESELRRLLREQLLA